MSSKVLDCEPFRGNNPLTGELIWKHRVSGGSEAIKEKLKEMYLWDGSSNVATIAAKLEGWHDRVLASLSVWQIQGDQGRE